MKMVERTRFKAFITTYALSTGISEHEVEDRFDISKDMVAAVNDHSWSNCFHRPHWHRTREEAVVQAEKMRVNKIASLERQIAKLKKLKFA